MEKPYLEMQGIYKMYANGCVANNLVDFSVNEGEIHALVGENGAGKSTLMKILFGIEKKDSGTIRIQDREVQIHTPSTAIRYGIGMVHQHFMLCPSLTVAENVMLGIMPKKGGPFSDKKKAIETTRALSLKYNMEINPTENICNLPVGAKQKVEIIKALVRGAKLLVLDEPTAVLTPQETAELFEKLKILKQNGHTIVFISHKLQEIFEVCDRITVLRGARTITTVKVGYVTEPELSQLIIGYDLPPAPEKAHYQSKDENTILDVKELSYQNQSGKMLLQQVNLRIKPGQILGIAAIEGNGQRELVSCITGKQNKYGGKIIFGNRDISGCSIEEIRNLGLAYIPEDRMAEGCVADMSIAENIIALTYKEKKFNVGVLSNREKIISHSAELSKRYRVKANDVTQKVAELSGGNIQKVVLARELTCNPELIIAEQPTRGIDVGSARFIHEELLKYRESGGAVLLISADIKEVLDLSDILVVMHNGEIVGYFDNLSEVSGSLLGEYMLGSRKLTQEESRRAFYG